MKTQVHKPSKASPGRDRLAFLEEAYRQTLESLEMAASLGIPEGVRPLGTVSLQPCPWLSTNHSAVRASFYVEQLYGPLPYAFGAVPGEDYQVFLLQAPR